MRLAMTEAWALLPAAAAELVLMATGKTKVEETELPQPYLLSGEASEPMEFSASSMESVGSGMLAVLPVVGPLSMGGEYGGTSLRLLERQIAVAERSPSIDAIVLHITSPGGTVTGTPEAADRVRAVRDSSQTNIYAFADGMMASAATWIGTAAQEVAINPSGDAGSIGVISMYAEVSKMLEEAGVSVSVIRNPDKKARFTGFEPLTDAMRETLEQRNLQAYERFKRAMADNRRKRVDTIESRFGGGEMMSADEAKDAGLVDRVESFDAALARWMPKRRKAPGARRTEIYNAMAESELLEDLG